MAHGCEWAGEFVTGPGLWFQDAPATRSDTADARLFPAVTIAMTVALLPLPGATQTHGRTGTAGGLIDTEIPFAALIDAVKPRQRPMNRGRH